MARKKKLYFKIGEACKRLDIQPYVLRYWETEFPALSPDKSKSGQRVYTTEDLQIIGRIKELLYEEGFTIAGAKKKLEAELKTGLKPLREKATTAAAEAASDADEADSQAIDTATLEEIESLKDGVRKALQEAQGLLEYLDSKSKSG